jgi:hypothetical protein
MVSIVAALAITLTPQYELKASILEYVEAVRTYNILKMESFFHPSYLEISPRGLVEDKSAILKSFDVPLEKRFVASKVDISEWKFATPKKDQVTSTFKQTYIFIRNEKEFKINIRVGSNWIREGRKWIMTFQQSTVLDTPPTRSGT